MIKFMAKVYMRNDNENAIQISDWTLFSLGTFVGSAYYIRPENYETQLIKDDWDIDWDTCFPGKFIKLCNDFSGPKRYGTAFYLCFSDEFDETKSLWCSTWVHTAPYNISYGEKMFFHESLTPNPNPNNYIRTIYVTTRYQTHAPQDQNYCWVFSDVPRYNKAFINFNEIVNYDASNPYLSSAYCYCVYKDTNDPDWYYGWNAPLYRYVLEINPPNAIKNFSFFMDELIDLSPVQVDYDPYVDGGGSSTGGSGGGGAWDDSSDVVQPSTLNLPNTTSIVKMYLLDDTTIASFASAINAQSFTNWQSYLPMFSNPLEALITLHWLPINYPASPVIGSITIGKYDTNIVADIISNQFVEFDLGSIHVNEYWGNYLDYDGTRLQLYLPYLSCINLLPDEVMGKDLRIKYNIDMLTGVCTAIVYTYNDTIIYSGSGNMAVEIPLSAITFSNLASNFLSATTSVIVAGATMAASGGTAVGGAALASASLSGATSIMSSKPNYSKAGYVGSTAGAMSYQTPYLLISRVAQCVPQYNNEFAGYPLYVTKKIGDCTGFTQVDNIHLKNMTATDSEKAQIIELLKGGVLV